MVLHSHIIVNQLIKHLAMKVYSGVGLQLFAVLTLTLERGKLSASCLCCLTAREIVPGVHWGGNWVGLRGSLDALEKRIIKP